MPSTCSDINEIKLEVNNKGYKTQGLKTLFLITLGRIQHSAGVLASSKHCSKARKVF